MVWKDKQLPGIEFIQKMVLKFRSLNVYWLLTGEGEMLNDPKKEECNISISDGTKTFNSREYLKSQKEIDQLKDKLTVMQEKYISLLEELHREKKNQKCG